MRTADFLFCNKECKFAVNCYDYTDTQRHNCAKFNKLKEAQTFKNNPFAVLKGKI